MPDGGEGRGGHGVVGLAELLEQAREAALPPPRRILSRAARARSGAREPRGGRPGS
jgi:hypothetical protein